MQVEQEWGSYNSEGEKRVFIRKHVLRCKRLQKWVESAIIGEVGNLFQFATTRARRHTCIRNAIMDIERVALYPESY